MKKKVFRLSAFLFSTLFVASSAVAGNCATKEIEQTEKFRTLDHVCQPGDSAPMAKRGLRVFYVVEGSALERTYEDGSKEVIDYKTGDSRILSDEKAFSYQNVGTTPIRFFIVYPK
jgi:hypothetical protein